MQPSFYRFLYSVRVTNAYIGLGSNLGDRAANLLLAVRALMESGLHVSRLSRVYETEAVETFPQPDFLNMVCELSGDDLPTPEEIFNLMMKIELQLGRTRDVLKAPRTIDLDLLLYGDEIRNDSQLQLPHPRLHLRRFVLEPLNELAPSLVHPTLKRSVSEMLASIDDASAVRIWRAGDVRSEISDLRSENLTFEI